MLLWSVYLYARRGMGDDFLHLVSGGMASLGMDGWLHSELGLFAFGDEGERVDVHIPAFFSFLAKPV